MIGRLEWPTVTVCLQWRSFPECRTCSKVPSKPGQAGHPNKDLIIKSLITVRRLLWLKQGFPVLSRECCSLQSEIPYPSLCPQPAPCYSRWYDGYRNRAFFSVSWLHSFLSASFFPQNLLQCALTARQHFPTFSVQTNHLGVLLKGRLWFSRTRVKSNTAFFHTLAHENLAGSWPHFIEERTSISKVGTGILTLTQHLKWVSPSKQFISLSSETFPWCLVSVNFISPKSGFKSTTHWLGYFRQVV